MSVFWWGVVAGVVAFWGLAGIAWLVYELMQGKRAARSLTGQLDSLRAELEATGGDARPSVPNQGGGKKLFREPKSLASQAAIRSRAEDLLRRRAERNAAARAQGGAA